MVSKLPIISWTQGIWTQKMCTMQRAALIFSSFSPTKPMLLASASHLHIFPYWYSKLAYSIWSKFCFSDYWSTWTDVREGFFALQFFTTNLCVSSNTACPIHLSLQRGQLARLTSECHQLKSSMEFTWLCSFCGSLCSRSSLASFLGATTHRKPNLIHLRGSQFKLIYCFKLIY